MGTLFDFNAGMGPHNRAAIGSLGATGHLPQDPFWGAMRGRHEANSARFEAGHPVMGALLRREQAQRAGTADGRTALFPRTPLWAHLRGRHDSHAARFGRYHPFLGKLFEIKLPAGLSVGTPPTGPVFGTDATGRAWSLTASDVPISSLTAPDVPMSSGAPIFDVPISLVEMPTNSQVGMPTNSQEAPHSGGSPVPEPSGMTLAGLGIVLVFLAGARSWWPRTG